MNRTPWTHSFHIAKVAALETVLINRSFKIVNNPDSINFRISKLVSQTPPYTLGLRIRPDIWVFGSDSVFEMTSDPDPISKI